MRIFRHGIFFFFSVLLFGSFSLEATELSLLIWEDYLADEVVSDFTKKTGISIVQSHFDSDQNRDELVASAKGQRFDLVLFDNIAAQIFGKNNKLLAISRANVPNIDNIDRKWSETCGNFGVPYFYGTTGIVYDKNKYPVPPQSWQALLMPENAHQGHVVMIDDFADTLVPALLYLGYNINTEKESELREAYALLENQVPSVLNYSYAVTNLKAAGEQSAMHMAFAYSGDQYALNEVVGEENWQYVIPREGTAIWMDCLTVTAWTKNKEASLRFLNYLLDLRVAAKNTEEIYSATPMSGVRQYLSEEAARDEGIFPDFESISNGQMYRIISNNTMLIRKRIVETLKRSHDAQ